MAGTRRTTCLLPLTTPAGCGRDTARNSNVNIFLTIPVDGLYIGPLLS